MSRIVTKIGYSRQRKWSIDMGTINGEGASSGPYASALIINFDASPDFKHLVLYKNTCKPVEPEKIWGIATSMLLTQKACRRKAE